MTTDHQEQLLALCKLVYEAQEAAECDYKQETFRGQYLPELLIRRVDAIKIEIRKETVSHHEPHIHITHSDKIDVSLCLTDFRILAGKIDQKTLKRLKPLLDKYKPHLIDIWNALNIEGDSRFAELLISNLPR